MRPRKTELTDHELRIMKVIWERGNATVRDVYEELLKHRKIAYTTVMTVMGVLEQKGRLKKSAAGRAYVYTPAQPQSEVVSSMVRDFVGRVFNGMAKPLLVSMLEDGKISEEELDELKKLLKEKRRKR
jgi:BlaI family transcriptional regulator, penicillinase repressor